MQLVSDKIFCSVEVFHWGWHGLVDATVAEMCTGGHGDPGLPPWWSQVVAGNGGSRVLSPDDGDAW